MLHPTRAIRVGRRKQDEAKVFREEEGWFMRSGLAVFQMVCSGWSAAGRVQSLRNPRDRSDGCASDLRSLMLEIPTTRILRKGGCVGGMSISRLEHHRLGRTRSQRNGMRGAPGQLILVVLPPIGLAEICVPHRLGNVTQQSAAGHGRDAQIQGAAEQTRRAASRQAGACTQPAVWRESAQRSEVLRPE